MYTIKISFDMLSKISAVAKYGALRQTNDLQGKLLAHPSPLSPMQNKTHD